MIGLYKFKPEIAPDGLKRQRPVGAVTLRAVRGSRVGNDGNDDVFMTFDLEVETPSSRH